MQPALDAVGLEREGIGCRFCHAIRGVNLDTFPPFELETELVMYGRFDDLESPVHEIRRSEFLGTPEYCAGCHEYTTPAGAPVLTTFSEFADADHPGCCLARIATCRIVLGQRGRLPSVTAVRMTCEFVDSRIPFPGGRSIGCRCDAP